MPKITITREFDTIEQAIEFLRPVEYHTLKKPVEMLAGGEVVIDPRVVPPGPSPVYAPNPDTAGLATALGGQTVAAPAAEPVKRPRGRPRKDAAPVKAEPQLPTAATEAVEATATEQTTALPAPTEDDCKALLEAVFNKVGFANAQQLLDSLGAKRLRDVPPEKYGEFQKEALKLLDGHN